MPLLQDNLTVWEISHRWAGYDPAAFRFRLPLPVRDNMRLLLHEIEAGYLFCGTLLLEKWREGSSTEPRYHYNYHISAIWDCLDGKSYDRKLMRWASIDRLFFELWCERRNVPLPEFWFPPGWTKYQWPDDEVDEQDVALFSDPDSRQNDEKLSKQRQTRITCQTIASRLWASSPSLSIKEMAGRSEILILGGGEDYEFETVQRWLSEVDPRDPSQKRGRKKKNN